jgi:chaperonin cofactor prefoldin
MTQPNLPEQIQTLTAAIAHSDQQLQQLQRTLQELSHLPEVPTSGSPETILAAARERSRLEAERRAEVSALESAIAALEAQQTRQQHELASLEHQQALAEAETRRSAAIGKVCALAAELERRVQGVREILEALKAEGLAAAADHRLLEERQRPEPDGFTNRHITWQAKPFFDVGPGVVMLPEVREQRGYFELWQREYDLLAPERSAVWESIRAASSPGGGSSSSMRPLEESIQTRPELTPEQKARLGPVGVWMAQQGYSLPEIRQAIDQPLPSDFSLPG